MFKFLTASIFSLALATTPILAQGPTIPAQGAAATTYTSRVFDAQTGLTHVTADVVVHGTLGQWTGTDSYTITPTGGLTGTGTRRHANGATYTLTFVGQFISATTVVGTYTTVSGPWGVWSSSTGSGSWVSTPSASGLGANVASSGTFTLFP